MFKTKFRIVKIGSNGRYRVEKKDFLFWHCALFEGADGFEADYESQDEAAAMLEKVYKSPPDVVIWVGY